MTPMQFTDQEFEDILSALDYFVRYFSPHGSKETRAAMRRIMARIRKKKRYAKKRED